MPNKIQITTKYGTFYDVPITIWKDLKPFWPDIIGPIIETIIEYPFSIQDFRIKSGKGFIAAEYYWKKYKRRSEGTPLSESRLFIELLKSNPQFVSAIRDFNSSSGKDWFKENNFSTLARFIRSVCLPIIPFLQSIQKTSKKLL